MCVYSKANQPYGIVAICTRVLCRFYVGFTIANSIHQTVFPCCMNISNPSGTRANLKEEARPRPEGQNIHRDLNHARTPSEHHIKIT